MLVLELLLVFTLILLNGFLAMSELAIVSARRSRLRTLAEAGSRGASTALSLLQNPGRFLSTVQFGITLVGVLAGAFSGATIAEQLADRLQARGISAATADTIALVAVVATITYLTVIIGELVPKHLALRNAEGVAAGVARPMTLLARCAAPMVWLLDVSSRVVLKLLGSKSDAEPTVTQEEIKTFIAEAETAGVVEPAETRMMARVMRLGGWPLRAVMTPRTEVDWIDLDDDEVTIRRKIRESDYSRLPVSRGGVDEVVGVVQAKDLLDAFLDGGPVDAAAFVRQAPVVHDVADALDVIEILKKSPVQMALVVDEYGAFEGVVTPADILETIVGTFEGEAGAEEPPAVQRDDGSWLIDGAMSCDDMADRLGIRVDDERDFYTVAGFVLAHLKHLPLAGETFEWNGWRFEVVDMDGRRVDKVLASRALILHRG